MDNRTVKKSTQRDDPTVYDMLAAQQAKITSISNLNDATKNTFIDSSNIEFWSGVITVARALKESRTYGHGIPIPETSDAINASIDDGADYTLKPSSPEVWQVVSLAAGNTVVTLKGASGSSTVPVDANGNLYSPIILTPTLCLHFDNASGAPVNIAVAYHKLGL